MRLIKLSMVVVILSLFTNTGTVCAQPSEGNVLITGYAGGLIRASNDPTDEGASTDFLLGLETNFFIEDQFSFTLGFDHYILNGGGDLTSIALGTRIYPTDYFFLRYKTNLSTQFKNVNDFIMGGGYDFYLNDSFYTELNVDYHLVARGFGIRLGIGVFL